MTQAIVGKIYKIKKGSENRCNNYSKIPVATKIKITAIDNFIHYRILSEKNWVLGNCWGCFTRLDLEDIEEIEKTHNNLEIGDVVMDKEGDKNVVMSVLPSKSDNTIYILSYFDAHKIPQIFRSAYELEKNGFTIFSTPPTPKKTVDDVLAQLSEEDKEIVKNALK